VSLTISGSQLARRPVEGDKFSPSILPWEIGRDAVA